MDKQEPVAWRHTLNMEHGQTHTRLSEDARNPFGEPGMDYSAEYTVTSEPLYTRANRPADDGLVADSGFTPENIADAEWLWANLPVGQTRFHDRPTHERALICHTVARFRQHILATALRAQSDAEVERETIRIQARKEAIEEAAVWLECRSDMMCGSEDAVDIIDELRDAAAAIRALGEGVE